MKAEATHFLRFVHTSRFNCHRGLIFHFGIRKMARSRTESQGLQRRLTSGRSSIACPSSPPTGRNLRSSAILEERKTPKGQKGASRKAPNLNATIKKEIIRFKGTLLEEDGPSEGPQEFADRLEAHLTQRLPSAGITSALVTYWVSKYPWIQTTNGVPPGKSGASLIAQVQAERLESTSTEGSPQPAEASPVIPTPPALNRLDNPSNSNTQPVESRPQSLEHRLANVESTQTETLKLLKKVCDIQIAQLRMQRSPPNRPRNKQKANQEIKQEISDVIDRIGVQQGVRRTTSRVRSRARTTMFFKMEPNDEVEFILERSWSTEASPLSSPARLPSVPPTPTSAPIKNDSFSWPAELDPNQTLRVPHRLMREDNEET